MGPDKNTFVVAASTLLGPRIKMDRFLNCFAVAILKFKMATILDLMW